MPDPLTRATIPLDPQRIVRPRSTPGPHPDPDRPDPVRHWETLLDGPRESNTFTGSPHAGLIPNRNPPAPPAVIANRAATDALFRRLRSGSHR